MKRFHVHVGVDNIDEAVKFYNTLFGAEPIKVTSDYAKWLLDDPHVTFAISTRAGKKGVDHLGIQVEDDEELTEIRQRLESADVSLFDEGQTVCCYSKADKSWVQDPSGIPWEAYKTMEDAQIFGEHSEAQGTCCAPDMPVMMVMPSKKASGCGD